MNVSDVIFDPSVPMSLKNSILDVLEISSHWSESLEILIPTDSNDDVNGSQHAENGGADFTYRDATVDDVLSASRLGFYDYFSGYAGGYTGHYYNGDGRYFAALVIDPPFYASLMSV